MKEVKVPVLPESISEATVAAWHKKPGDYVELDDVIVEIETDKITVEVPAPQAGSLSEIKVNEGSDVKIGGVLGIIGDIKISNKTEPDQTKNFNPKGKSSPFLNTGIMIGGKVYTTNT